MLPWFADEAFRNLMSQFTFIVITISVTVVLWQKTRAQKTCEISTRKRRLNNFAEYFISKNWYNMKLRLINPCMPAEVILARSAPCVCWHAFLAWRYCKALSPTLKHHCWYCFQSDGHPNRAEKEINKFKKENNKLYTILQFRIIALKICNYTLLSS